MTIPWVAKWFYRWIVQQVEWERRGLPVRRRAVSGGAVNISGAIVTLNEEANIGRAVRSLRFCDEVVVVDCGSTDRTCRIAESLGARVIESEWRGYAGQKNFCAQAAANDWILSIDADEEVSAELAREIEEVRRKGTERAAFDFPRLARYRGRLDPSFRLVS